MIEHGSKWWVAAVASVIAFGAAPAGAQALNYPSFQPPRVVAREFSGAVAGGGGTAVVGEWREGVGLNTQFNIQTGVFDPEGLGDARFIIGGGLAQQLTREAPQQPLAVLLTGGIYASFGNDVTIVNVPLGVSIGHRIALDGGMAITPYVHPRVSLAFCGDCADDTDVGIDFDLGADLELTRQLSLRASVLFSGGGYLNESDASFGVGLAYRPPMMR